MHFFSEHYRKYASDSQIFPVNSFGAYYLRGGMHQNCALGKSTDLSHIFSLYTGKKHVLSVLSADSLSVQSWCIGTRTITEMVCTKTVHWENPRIISIFSLCTLGKYAYYPRILSVYRLGLYHHLSKEFRHNGFSMRISSCMGFSLQLPLEDFLSPCIFWPYSYLTK